MLARLPCNSSLDWPATRVPCGFRRKVNLPAKVDEVSLNVPQGSSTGQRLIQRRAGGRLLGMFDGFEEGMVDAGGFQSFLRFGGIGPSVLRMHGHPLHDPAVVRGMLEDYGAGLIIDADHERADRAAGRRVQQPLLLLWSTRDDLEDLYGNPLRIWQDWADSVTGHGIDSGHNVAE